MDVLWPSEQEAKKSIGSLSALFFAARPAALHAQLQSFLLTEEELDRNGYPRPPSPTDPPHSAAFHRLPTAAPRLTFLPDSELARFCCRCAARFRLHRGGEVGPPTRCSYHWGHLVAHQPPRTHSGHHKDSEGLEKRWSCCQRSEGVSGGCAQAPRHVTDASRVDDTRGFVQTKPSPEDDDPRLRRVYSLDCEMVYTVWGLGLARVTVVDGGGHVVLDAHVRPSAAIVDCNTRFSGVTPAHFNGTHLASREDIQEELLSLVSADTILIGHSLQADLRSLKIPRGGHVAGVPAPQGPRLQARPPQPRPRRPRPPHPGPRPHRTLLGGGRQSGAFPDAGAPGSRCPPAIPGTQRRDLRLRRDGAWRGADGLLDGEGRDRQLAPSRTSAGVVSGACPVRWTLGCLAGGEAPAERRCGLESLDSESETSESVEACVCRRIWICDEEASEHRAKLPGQQMHRYHRHTAH